MGRNLAMISDHHWQGLPFRTIIEAELSQVVSLDDPRILISGPDVLLSVRSTKWMALLVHEMVTNAVRHGCCSVHGGTLSVTWQMEDDVFSSDWIETGRRETGEPERQGFGSQLLGLMPNVRIAREFHDGGMHVRTVAPSRFFSMSD